MKSKLILLCLVCFMATQLAGQNLVNDFVNNRVTTSSIVFTADGKQIIGNRLL